MALGGKKLLAIDWDRRHLRLVLVHPSADGVELLKAVSVPIPAEVVMDQPESLGAFIREAARQAKVGAKRVVMCIPRDQVVLNTLSVPAGPAADLPAIVQFQIAKELPFAVEQATLEFAVVGTFNPQEPGSLLVAAVRNEQLQFYKSAAAEAGLTVERIGLRPHANLIAVLAKAPERAQKSLLLVEVGPLLTEIDIIRDGALAFSRAASVAVAEVVAERREPLKDSRIESLPLIERERDEASQKAVAELMLEVTRSFEAYRATEAAASVDQIVVCGAMGIEHELTEMLAARFACRAELFTPDRALSLPAQRAKELRGFSAALGLAIGHDGEGLGHFDFLHPKKPVSRRAIRLKKVPTVVLTGAFLIAAAVTGHYKYVAPVLDKEAELQTKLSKLRSDAKVVTDFQAQVEAVDDWQQSEQCWPDVLKVLTEAFPSDQEAYATRVDFETKRPVKKDRLRPSSAKVVLRTAAAMQVDTLAATLKDCGFKAVRKGKDSPFTSHVPTEAAYSHDTDIEADLPGRTALAIRDTSAEEGEEFPVEEVPTTGKADQARPSAPRAPEGTIEPAKPVGAPEAAAPDEGEAKPEPTTAPSSDEEGAVEPGGEPEMDGVEAGEGGEEEGMEEEDAGDETEEPPANTGEEGEPAAASQPADTGEEQPSEEGAGPEGGAS